MPYVEDLEQKKKEDEQGGATSETITSPQSPPPAGTGGGQQGGSGQGVEGFTNVNQYLNVNRQQGQNLQNKVVGGVEQKNQQAQNKIQQGEQAFNQRVSSGTYQSNPEYEQNVARNAANVVSNSDQLADVQKRLGGYQGPTQRDIAEETTAISEAGQSSQALGSGEGRMGLLGQQFNRFDYGRGQKTLDNLLLSGSQGFSDRANTAQQQFGNLSNYFNQSRQKSAQDVKQAQATSKQAADSLKAALSGEEASQRAGLKSRLEEVSGAEKAKEGRFDQIRTALSGNIQNLSPEALEGARDLFSSDKEFNQFKDYISTNQKAKGALDAARANLAGSNAYWSTKGTQKSDEDVADFARSVIANQEKMNRYQGGDVGALSGLDNRFLGGNSKAAQDYLDLFSNYGNLSSAGSNIANALNYQGAQNLTAQGLASPEQRAQLSALAQLQGQTDEFGGQQMDYRGGGADFGEYGDLSQLQSILAGLRGGY